MTTQPGRFITFEGGEGAGKSTQIAALAGHLTARQIPHIVTREPGGTGGAEAIRGLLVSGDAECWAPEAEILLHYAARADHLDRVIRPALARGDWVLCDRFMDSTRAYQGGGQGGASALIDSLEALVVAGNRPDLTLILDMPVAQGLQRAAARSAHDRYESMGEAFHERLRRAFLDIARDQPERCAVIDATPAADELSETIWTLVSARFLS